MKINRLFQFLIACCLLVQLACDNCVDVECEVEGGYVQLRLMRDTTNAVFGPNAFVDADSIRFHVVDTAHNETGVDTFSNTRAIGFFLNTGFNYVLDLPGVGQDTIEITTEVSGMNECCKTYRLYSVWRNGVQICADTCEKVIRLEI